jgi:hypothetical protein
MTGAVDNTLLRMARTGHPTILEAIDKAAEMERARRVVNALRAAQKPLITTMERDTAAWLKGMGQLVAAAAQPLLGQLYEARWRSPLDSTEVANLIDNILHSAHLREWEGGRVAPSFYKHYEATDLITARTLIQAGILANLRGSAARRVLQEGGRRLGLLDLGTQTRAALFRAIDQAYEQGLGPRATAKLIRDIVPAGPFPNAGAGYRATLIARTETLHAQRFSTLQRYREDKRVKQVIVFDGESDEECSARNGEYMTLDEAEAEMNSTHPNCVMAFGPA